MTHEELVTRMKTDPAFVVSFIIQNNPKRVYENMLANGIVTSLNANIMYSDLMKFAAKKPDTAIAILNIPIRETEEQMHLTEAVKSAGIFNPVSSKNSIYDDTFNPDDVFDEYEDRPDDPSYFEDEETSGNWNWDWIGNFFGALGGAFQAFGPGQQPPQNEPEDSSSKPKSMTIILIVLLVVAIIVGMIFLKK
ncbi:MAG: hypothetical protein PF448_08730 [Bacteroidales bacterium]|jgi:hypothetical protein|nr:hypothetical protein [Bacteroidales bacterium]